VVVEEWFVFTLDSRWQSMHAAERWVDVVVDALISRRLARFLPNCFPITLVLSNHGLSRLLPNSLTVSRVLFVSLCNSRLLALGAKEVARTASGPDSRDTFAAFSFVKDLLSLIKSLLGSLR
jgi:hypothetical protein